MTAGVRCCSFVVGVVVVFFKVFCASLFPDRTENFLRGCLQFQPRGVSNFSPSGDALSNPELNKILLLSRSYRCLEDDMGACKNLWSLFGSFI